MQRLYKMNVIAKLVPSKVHSQLFYVLINRLFQIKQNISTKILHGNLVFTTILFGMRNHLKILKNTSSIIQSIGRMMNIICRYGRLIKRLYGCRINPNFAWQSRFNDHIIRVHICLLIFNV